MKKRAVTWMILRDGGKILLGWKKRGFGEGKLNGIGGKVDPGETIEQAAVREMREESGVTATKYEKTGTIIFDELTYNNERQQMTMHCYVATKWEGELRETDEILPEWFDISEIPYEKMWADDEFWLPQMLDGEKVEGKFKYNDNFEIIEQSIKVLS